MIDSLIAPADADRLIAAALPDFAAARVALAEAPGRILLQRVRAETAQPPFDRVMMDGIAIRRRERLPSRFHVAGRQLAGSVGAVLQADDGCIEVATGAPLPEGCDCVVPVEQTRRDGDLVALADGYAPAPGQFVHRAGSDCDAGAVVLEPGVRIGGPEMSLLASNGVAVVEVAADPPVAVIATGDELVPVEAAPGPGRIRRSNDLALLASLRQEGFGRVSLHHAADDRGALRDTLRSALAERQVLVLSGGVSMGQRDHVPEILQALGVRQLFHGIAQRPGKPMWFGVGADGQAVFALPGNPVSSLVCMTRYVRPALLAASGLARPTEHARLDGDAGRAIRLTRFLPARTGIGADAVNRAQVRGWSNSGDFTALGGTQGFVELPAGRETGAGEPVPFFRW